MIELAVLLYDHRNLGASEGAPRQEINPWIECRGYLDAIDITHTSTGSITAASATAGPLPVVSPDQLGSPSLLEPAQAFRWFIEHGARRSTTRVSAHVAQDPSPWLGASCLRM